jgi:hypothetical protein
LLPENVEGELHNKEEDTASRSQSEYLRHEAFVESSETFLSSYDEKRGNSPL